MSRAHIDPLQKPELSTGDRIVGLSTDAAPTVGPDGGALSVGQLWVHEDTGRLKWWTGSAWELVEHNQEIRLQTALLFELRDYFRGDE